MKRACRSRYPYPPVEQTDEDWPKRSQCLSRASLYGRLVSNHGKAAYDAAQREACECCPPDYEGSLHFETQTADSLTQGVANIRWTQFESDSTVRRFSPTGDIVATISRTDCDSLQVTIPIETYSPAAPHAALVVYSPTNTALPSKYQFGVAGAGTFIMNCGTPRMPVALPGSSIMVLIGICQSLSDMPEYTNESTLQGTLKCPQTNLTSASWSFISKP